LHYLQFEMIPSTNRKVKVKMS